MTISYNWLKEYIDLPESPEEIAMTLTSTGLEVESIHLKESINGGLKGLVIGEVISCSKHPNADKLSITTVDVGGKAPLTIVCGAPNVASGQKVIVAVPGVTVYPTKGQPFTIQDTKIRGERSEGMICAEDEIGVGESHAGIIVLKTDLPNGSLATQHYKVESDHIFEIGLTPNRADAASHIGVARDIKAAKGRKVMWPTVDSFKPDSNNLKIDIQVENPDACIRYSGLTMSGISVKPSPAWLAQRLQSIGITPINNIVDITNFVCHETGQPLHAFDAAKVQGNKVVVKTLPAGTKFTTLDNKERSLTSQDLMICDAREGMCIAGVYGGAKSGISDKTSSLFLESACFSPKYVRKTSAHHQLSTDAAFRFSRGTDPAITVYALKRAALLIKELAGGTISSDIIDVYPREVKNRIISIKDKNVRRLIGKEIPRNEIISILGRLDIEVDEQKPDQYSVKVPPYRVDVEQEADVIEEILRIYGFNSIELRESTKADYLADFPEKDINKFKRVISEMLAGNGFNELVTNSLTNVEYQRKHSLAFKGKPVEMLNKLSEEQGILRQTMLFTGLEVLAYNFNRKQTGLRMFEFGKVYDQEKGNYREDDRLGLYMAGSVEAETWIRKPKVTDYHELAQQVAQILDKCGCQAVSHLKLEDQLFDYGLKFMSDGVEIAVAGKVKAMFAKEFGIKHEIFFADLSTLLLFQSASPKFGVREVTKFPEVKRDLSLVIDKRISFDEIRKVAAGKEIKLIKEVTAIDVYEGENIPKGKKAYALGFTLQDETKTLTDEEIEKTMNNLMAEFEKKLGAVIRK